MVNTMGSERFNAEVSPISGVTNSDSVTSEVHPLGGVMLEIWLECGGFISLDYYAK